MLSRCSICCLVRLLPANSVAFWGFDRSITFSWGFIQSDMCAIHHNDSNEGQLPFPAIHLFYNIYNYKHCNLFMNLGQRKEWAVGGMWLLRCSCVFLVCHVAYCVVIIQLPGLSCELISMRLPVKIHLRRKATHGWWGHMSFNQICDQLKFSLAWSPQHWRLVFNKASTISQLSSGNILIYFINCSYMAENTAFSLSNEDFSCSSLFYIISNFISLGLYCVNTNGNGKVRMVVWAFHLNLWHSLGYI